MSVVKEFREFAIKGNVVDLAVGVVIGAAFGKIVSSFVEDVVMPPLGVLVGGVKRLRPAGGSLALVCTDDNITKIFEITGLDRVFPIHSSRDEALAAVATAD